MADTLSSSHFQQGIILAEHDNTIITHVLAAFKKCPLQSMSIPVTLYELSSGIDPSNHTSSPVTSSPSKFPAVTFSGQYGMIDFDTTIRLPRHVHITEDHFTAERILVIDGTALVELNKKIYIIPPRTLVTIAPGVPHTWTACPAGFNISEELRLRQSVFNDGDVKSDEDKLLGDPIISTGTFLMIYEYEEVTAFFPTEQWKTLKFVGEYRPCNDLERIRFPRLDLEELRRKGWMVWNEDVWKICSDEQTSFE